MSACLYIYTSNISSSLNLFIELFLIRFFPSASFFFAFAPFCFSYTKCTDVVCNMRDHSFTHQLQSSFFYCVPFVNFQLPSLVVEVFIGFCPFIENKSYRLLNGGTTRERKTCLFTFFFLHKTHAHNDK